MKLLHTSDWHLGMLAGNSPMEECQRYFLEQLYEIIKEERVSAVLCAGDVYDSSVSNADAIALYDGAITAICAKLGVPMVVIAGNHDGAARLASGRRLLERAGFYVTGRLVREIEPVCFGDTAVYPIPFFNRDEVAALFPEHKDGIRSQEMAFQTVCDRIRSRMDKGKRNIILAHALIVAAELSESDRSARIGMASAVSQEVFAGFDYVALGHLHKPQIVAPHIRYCGSPVPYSFGKEETQQKGVVILETETMEQRFVPLRQLHGRKTVEGTYDEIWNRTDLGEDYLRLMVTDRYAGLDLLATMRERFPYLLELYGKSLAEQGEMAALTVEELQHLEETEIMKKFFAEVFEYEPDAAQIALFDEVRQWAERGDGLS